ncbi:MFS transporter [Ligilactobacillus equi]|nr:MFS transporter [Ligilactobacillus equi]
MTKKPDKERLYTKDVILVMAASFFFMFSNMFINTIINGYAQSLGATESFAGMIVGMMSLTSMFLRPIAGNLTDRFSKYALSLIGGIFIFIGIAGYVLTPNSQLLLLFRLLNGTGFVLCTVCMTTWLATLVPRAHVGQAMGFYGLMNALAMAVGPAVSINLYTRIGYKHTILIGCGAAVAMMLMVLFVSDHAIPQAKPQTRQKKKFKLIQKDALPVAFLTTLFALPYFATQSNLVVYTEERNLHVAVGSYFLIYAVVLLIIRIALKEYFDTVRFRYWFYISIIATAFYLLMLTVMKNNFQMALGAAGMAIGYGVIYSVLQSTALLLAPMGEQGLASSTFYLGLDVGMAMGPILGGFIDAQLSPANFYPVMFILLPIMFLIYLPSRHKLNGAIDHH